MSIFKDITRNTKVFLDVDGILADFVGGMCKAHKRTSPYENPNFTSFFMEEEWNMSSNEFWAPANNREFWANLEPTEECFGIIKLLEYIVPEENISLLSKPSLDPNCVSGKVDWIYKHLPTFKRRFLLGPPKHMVAHENAVLIDDYDGNIESFKEHGGLGVVWPQPWNSMRHFQSLKVFVR